MSLILISSILGIIGVAYVSFDKSLKANSIWAIGNVGMIYHNYTIHEWEMMGMFIIYWLLAVYGIWNLQFKKK